jgi:hypothetical protein
MQKNIHKHRLQQLLLYGILPYQKRRHDRKRRGNHEIVGRIVFLRENAFEKIFRNKTFSEKVDIQFERNNRPFGNNNENVSKKNIKKKNTIKNQSII